MNRQEALDAAAKCVLTDRNKDYGSPEDNFATTAQIWNAYLAGRGLLAPGKVLESYDVAAIMVGLKLARLCTSPTKDDNWTDLIGYGACGAECATPQPLPTGPGLTVCGEGVGVAKGLTLRPLTI